MPSSYFHPIEQCIFGYMLKLVQHGTRQSTLVDCDGAKGDRIFHALLSQIPLVQFAWAASLYEILFKLNIIYIYDIFLYIAHADPACAFSECNVPISSYLSFELARSFSKYAFNRSGMITLSTTSQMLNRMFHSSEVMFPTPKPWLFCLAKLTINGKGAEL